MPAAVKTSVTELPESRVRVEAEVPAEEIERRMQATARQLGQNLRMPGFRKGKVPPPVVIQRIGRESVLDETVRGAMGRWYLDAIDAAGIHPVGDPELDVGDLPGEGQPLTFTIEIGVRPAAALGEYKGVEVGKREAGADDAAVDAEVEALRERSARLETAEGAAADNGDFVVMDYVGSIDGENFAGGRGATSSSSWVRAPRARLRGAAHGRQGRRRAHRHRPLPRRLRRGRAGGKEAQFAVTVKEIKRKDLPALDDDFASDAAGFDTLAELREDITAKLREADESRVEAEFREAVLDAVVRDSKVEVPATLVDARAQELWERMLHSLSHQGITKEAYLRIAGREEADILEEAKPDAEQALRREAVIAAVVEAEGIEPSEGDVLDALQTTAARERTTPEKLRARPREGGPPGRPARGPRPARRDRPAGRERDSNIRRAGPGA